MEEPTILFGRIASAYFLVTGLGFLISTEFYERMVRGSDNTDPVTLNLSGAVHFLVGLTILSQHFRWRSLSEVMVTVIGVAATLKGAGLIAVPGLALKSPKTSKATLRMSGLAFSAVGVYLLYACWF